MSIEGNASNSRAPEERNVYSRAYLPQILKPQRGDMCIEYQLLSPLKPQRGDMCHIGLKNDISRKSLAVQRFCVQVSYLDQQKTVEPVNLSQGN